MGPAVGWIGWSANRVAVSFFHFAVADAPGAARAPPPHTLRRQPRPPTRQSLRCGASAQRWAESVGSCAAAAADTGLAHATDSPRLSGWLHRVVVSAVAVGRFCYARAWGDPRLQQSPTPHARAAAPPCATLAPPGVIRSGPVAEPAVPQKGWGLARGAGPALACARRHGRAASSFLFPPAGVAPATWVPDAPASGRCSIVVSLSPIRGTARASLPLRLPSR